MPVPGLDKASGITHGEFRPVILDDEGGISVFAFKRNQGAIVVTGMGINRQQANVPGIGQTEKAGKDRTGLVCAVIEALTGASSEEITADFMKSFYNYFGVIPNSKEYEFIASHEIKSFLASMLGVKNIDDANLYAAAEKYLLKIGVSSENIMKVREKLKGNFDDN